MPHIGTEPSPSYAQAGEDRIVYFLFEMLGSVRNLRYADLGAAFPTGHNNTYLFYTLGGSGLLVEADPSYRPAYREARPRDRVEQAAVVPARLTKQGHTVHFHAMQNPGWSTVSEEHVQVGTSLGKGPVRQTLAVPCMTINDLLEKHFPDGRLDILSMDLEGVDQEVLGELDLTRFRPKVIIIERPGAVGTLCPTGYQLFASTFVNLILVDSNCLQSIKV
jgi:FkbM family methyltransferase